MQEKENVIHYTDMTREQLINLVCNMEWYALDLAQDLRLTKFGKPEYISEMIDRDCQMAYNLTHFWEFEFETTNVNLVKVDGNGVESCWL